MSVQVRLITDNELKEFVDFPFELYKDNPYWVGELKADTV